MHGSQMYESCNFESESVHELLSTIGVKFVSLGSTLVRVRISKDDVTTHECRPIARRSKKGYTARQILHPIHGAQPSMSLERWDYWRACIYFRRASSLLHLLEGAFCARNIQRHDSVFPIAICAQTTVLAIVVLLRVFLACGTDFRSSFDNRLSKTNGRILHVFDPRQGNWESKLPFSYYEMVESCLTRNRTRDPSSVKPTCEATNPPRIWGL